MKRFKTVAVIISGIVAIAVGCSIWWSEADQQRRNHDFASQEIRPLARWIIDFRETNHRLPTEKEFRDWSDKEYYNKLIDYFLTRPKFCRKWGKDGTDFIVGMWNGSWIHYYCSWDGSDFAGPN